MLVDYRGKLPGRGAYTCVDSDCITSALRRGGFERSFKGVAVKAPSAERLVDDLVAQSRQRIVSLLGMARKAGIAVSGSSLVIKMLGGSESPLLVVVAEDISDAIGAKIAAKAEATGTDCFRVLDKGSIGRVLGKGERSAVAFEKSSLAETIKSEILRYKQIVGES